jgi:hypothetical protein
VDDDMANVSRKTVYFAQPGRQNTDTTLRLVKERAEELKIRNIVIASSTGATGVKASRLLKDHNLVVVSSVTGFLEPDSQRFLSKNRAIIEDNGGKIITAAHAFGTLGRAVHRKFGTIQIDEIIANVLRLFSQGVKVACEVACMAVDAGLIRTNEEAVSIGGSGGGADTAVILQPSNTHTFFDTRIKEIICKPRL